MPITVTDEIIVSSVIDGFMRTSTESTACAAIGALTTAAAAAVYQPLNAKLTTYATEKRYRATVSQSGSGAPIATVMQNELGGVPVFTRLTDGSYALTLAGAFPFAKTTVFLSSGAVPCFFSAPFDSADDVVINTFGTDGIQADSLLANAFLLIIVNP